MNLKSAAILNCFIVLFLSCSGQKHVPATTPSAQSNWKDNSPVQPGHPGGQQQKITPGAERIDMYLPLIKGKRVGIFANQTSKVGNSHLVDTLRKLGIDIKVIFGPEHGFRGTAEDGDSTIKDFVDKKTGIPVISLYGSKKKPSAEDLKYIDVLIFDIQDVGVRYYTFISSFQEYMEAAIENNKPLIILDRPNPNGFYVDGPVLDPKFKSFVGMQPVPIVYGMTIGEYAKMLLFERWLKKDVVNKLSLPDTMFNHAYLDDPTVKFPDYLIFSAEWFGDDNNHSANFLYNKFHLRVINCENYNHKSRYVLPINPSPNLPNIQSIYLYPSTCLFEGTALSEGRGTNKQFQVFGHPSLPKNLYAFTPNPNAGSKNSKHFGKVCYGWNLSGSPKEVLQKVDNNVQLKWLIKAYKLFPDKENFFLKTNFFNLLAGNDVLMQQIKDGKSEEEIRKSWEPAIIEFKKIRKKYLLYKDFE